MLCSATPLAAPPEAEAVAGERPVEAVREEAEERDMYRSGNGWVRGRAR